MDLVRFHVCITVLIACRARQLAYEGSLTHLFERPSIKKVLVREMFNKKIFDRSRDFKRTHGCSEDVILLYRLSSFTTLRR